MQVKDFEKLLNILKKNIYKLPVKDVNSILNILIKYVDKNELETKIKAV